MLNSSTDRRAQFADPAVTAALTGLCHASTGLQPDAIPEVAAGEAARIGLTDLTIFLADLEQRLLVPLPQRGTRTPDPLSIDGTIAGRCYRTEKAVVAPTEAADAEDATGVTIWLPLLDSAERLGVITVRFAGEVDQEFLGDCGALSNLIGEIIANKSDYGDSIIRTRRTQDVTLAAEMRWAMLPPLTYTATNLAISGIVEPAYGVAGDTFDYAVNGDEAHIAIIDAVGHGLEAARIANLAVMSYRHSRRRQLGAIETYWVMDDVVSNHFGSEKFATAQLAKLLMSSGQLSWLNAGHPPPMVIRRGHRLDLTSEVCLPVGLAGAGVDTEPKLAQTLLEPGDLVLFFSDGVVEARSPEGEEFGRERLADLMERAAAAAQTPAETMRLLGHAVLNHQNGMLQDDATLLLLAWEGPPPGSS